MAQFTCSKDHSHARVQGSDTVKTGLYSRRMAEARLEGLGIHKTFHKETVSTMPAAPQCTQSSASLAAPPCTPISEANDFAPQCVSRKASRVDVKKSCSKGDKVRVATEALVAV